MHAEGLSAYPGMLYAEVKHEKRLLSYLLSTTRGIFRTFCLWPSRCLRAGQPAVAKSLRSGHRRLT
jgi:hypothetical protein